MPRWGLGEGITGDTDYGLAIVAELSPIVAVKATSGERYKNVPKKPEARKH